MRKIFLILSLLMFGCAFVDNSISATDYKGVRESVHKRPFTIKKIERDPTSPDIFYLECQYNTRNRARFRAEQRKQLLGLAAEYGYMGYHIISHYQDPFALFNTWTLEIHFHKTEEDFDKWDKRYKE